MKKFRFITVLMAAGVIAASGLFAQELKFDGYFNSGIGLIISDRKDAEDEAVDPKFKVLGVDSEQWGYRFRLNGSYANSDNNAGFKFRIQSQSRTDTSASATIDGTTVTLAVNPIGVFGLPYAYGWVSFLDNKITLNGGIVDNGTWASGGAILNDDQGEGLGILAVVSPIAGLDLGIGAYLRNVQSGSNNNTLYDNNSAGINFANLNVNPLDAKYTFNVGYTAADLLKLSATFRLKNKAGGAASTSYDVDDYKYGGRDESSRAIIAARLLMVDNLTAIVEAELNKIEDFGDSGTITIYETVGYKLGSLNVGLNMAQYLNQVEDPDNVADLARKGDVGLRFNPWVSYALGSIVPRLDLVYFNGGIPDGISATSDDWKYFRNSYASNFNSKYSTITARPSVKFNLDSKTFVEIGDAFSYIMGPDGSFAQGTDPDNSSRINNVFYVDFKWSF
jgi:hypothetical protein